MVIVGRDVVSGLPIEMEMSGAVVYEAIKDNLNTICNSIKMILEKTPPELARDIIHSGIYITGGSSQIHDLDQFVPRYYRNRDQYLRGRRSVWCADS